MSSSAQPPQPPYGGQPPHGYYEQGPPPKKKHTVRNIILGVLLLCILGFAGCIALIGGAATEVDKAVKKEAANDRPRDVKEGAAFEHDGYKVDAGWSVSKDGFVNTVTIKKLRVTNVSGEDETGGGGRTALLTFRLYKGKENLAEVTCTGKELQKGESSAMDCSSGDKMPKGYKAIRVSDVF